MLPAPVGVVLDLNVVDDNLTGNDLDHVSGVRNDDSALELVGSAASLLLPATFLVAAFPFLLAAFPLLLAVLPLFLVAAALEILLALLPLLLGLFPVKFFGVDAHLVHETANHVFPPHSLVCDLLFGPFVSRLAVVTAVVRAELASHLVPGFLHFLPVGLGRLFTFLVEDGNDS